MKKLLIVSILMLFPLKAISCENLGNPSWWESYPEEAEILSEIGICSDINLPGKGGYPPLHITIFVKNILSCKHKLVCANTIARLGKLISFFPMS